MNLRLSSAAVLQRFSSNDSHQLNSNSQEPTKYNLPTTGFPDEPLSSSVNTTLSVNYPKCVSCGIALQHTNPKEPGYSKRPQYKRSDASSKAKDAEFLKAFSQLDEEGKKILEESIEQSNVSLVKERKLEEKRTRRNFKGEKLSGMKCVRCYDALHHSKMDLKETRVSNIESVLSTIPESAEIVHVVSAYDFPLGLMTYPKGRKVRYVINKADLLFQHVTPAESHGLQYFSKVMERLTRTTKYNLVSANNQWGISRLLDALPMISYLVGFVNSGKSLLGSKLQKKAVTNAQSSRPWGKAHGTSFIPGLTRDNIEVDLVDRLAYDTPGFLPKRTAFDLVKPECVKVVLSGSPMYSQDMRKARYLSVHGGQCYTLGGLIYLIPPTGSLLQIVSPTKSDPMVLKDLKKAVEIVRNPPKSVKKVVVKPETVDNLVRHVIPPFKGKIDLLIKDYGYIQIKPVGGKSNDDLFEVWAPEGVILGARSAMADFVTRSVPFNEAGQPIKKGSKEKAHRVYAKPIPNEKIFTRLYQVPVNCTDTTAEMIRQYEEHIKKEGSSCFNQEKERKYSKDANKYWIEKVWSVQETSEL